MARLRGAQHTNCGEVGVQVSLEKWDRTQMIICRMVSDLDNFEVCTMMSRSFEEELSATRCDTTLVFHFEPHYQVKLRKRERWDKTSVSLRFFMGEVYVFGSWLVVGLSLITKMAATAVYPRNTLQPFIFFESEAMVPESQRGKAQTTSIRPWVY
jgi:hypothetical protein